MANKTNIEWTDWNWNFLRGCSRVSEGCRNCYAETVAARFSGPGLPYEGLAEYKGGDARWTGKISFHEDTLLKPLRWTKPRKVFVNSMSDLFHEDVKDEWLDKAFAVMALTPQHTYQILTKRPERMREYLASQDFRYCVGSACGDLISSCSLKGDLRKRVEKMVHAFFGSDTGPDGDEIFVESPMPLPNVWLGVSVEDQKTADERIPLLLQTPAALRWVSAEPLLGPIDFEKRIINIPGGYSHYPLHYQYTDRGETNENGQAIWDGRTWKGPHLDWIVVGGESGTGARSCDLHWIEHIIDQCKAASVPVFVKQLGKYSVQKCDECGRMMGHCLGGAVDACGPTHAATAKGLMQIRDTKGGDIDEWPENLRVREYPEVAR